MTQATITPATLAQHLTDNGYQAQRAGHAFVKRVGTKLDNLAPADRGLAMVDAFLAALAEPGTTAITGTDPSVDLGIRAAAKINS